jgi:hypothetical protein
MDTDTQPLVAALHAHIQTVATRPIDIRMLAELEKTCLLARELMVIGQNPDALSKRRLVTGFDSSIYDTGGGGMMVSPSYMGQSAYSSPQETFGVTAIRELVGSLASFMPKPKEPEVGYSDLVSAITVAKAAGDTELEQQLRAELRLKLQPASGQAEVVALPLAQEPEAVAS